MSLRFCPLGRFDNGQPPPQRSYVDEDVTSRQQRRRVAVACARCRRRKIRCSGDPGDNSGCHNCRSAGADINECKFTRVGSAEIPFSSLGYHHNGSISTSVLPLSLVTPTCNPYSHSGPDSQYVSASPRLSYHGPFSATAYVDHQLDPYAVPLSTHVSTQEHMAGPYPLADPTRQYQALMEPRPQLSTRGYIEPDHLLSLGPPPPSLINTSVPRSFITSTESLPPVSISSLSLNHTDRQLPLPPAGTRGSFMIPRVDSPLGIRMTQTPTYANPQEDARLPRQSLPWTDPLGASQSSYHAPSSEATTTYRERTHLPARDQEEAILGFGSTVGNSELSPVASSTSSFSTMAAVTPYTDNAEISMLSNIPVTTSSVAMRRSNSFDTAYTVAGSAIGTARSMVDISGPQAQYNASILNGQRFMSVTPIAHPQPAQRASLDTLRYDQLSFQSQQHGRHPQGQSERPMTSRY